MKHLVDLDEGALASARDKLGANTIKDTVNLVLRQVAEHGATEDEIEGAMDFLASIKFVDRAEAWR